MINSSVTRSTLLIVIALIVNDCAYGFANDRYTNAGDTLFVLQFTQRKASYELRRLTTSVGSNEEKVFALAAFALHDRTMSKPESRSVALQAMQIAKGADYQMGMGLSYLALTASCENSIQLDTCIEKAIAIFRQLDSPNLEAITRLYGSYSLMNLGEYHTRAFGLVNQFFADYKLKTDSSSLTIAWNLLGEIYRTIKDDAKALQCYRIADKYSSIPGGSLYPAPTINIGTTYKNLGKYDSAIYMYEKASHFDTSGRSTLSAYLANRMAQVFMLQDKLELAEQHALAARALYDSLDNKQGDILTAGTLSLIYFKQKDFSSSKRYGELTVRKAMETGLFPDEVTQVCELLTNLYEQSGDYEKALYYHRQLSFVNDKLYGPLVSLEMYDEQMKLESRNLELEKNLLLEQQQATMHQASRQRTVLIIVILILVMSVAGVIALWRSRRTIKELNRELNEKHNEVMAQSEELKASHDEMEAMNSNLEGLVRERSEKVLRQNQKLKEYAFFNSHKVRGPLARILGLVSVFSKELEQSSMLHYSEMLRQAGDDLDGSIKEINKILYEEDED